MSGTLLSLGHGYSAQALARRLLPRGWRVIGTTRSPEKAARIADTGAEPLVWPGGALDDALGRATHLLVSAAPDAAGDPVLNAAGDAIAAGAGGLVWVGYLSTTGVYGDRGGGWVTEDDPLRPSTRRGQWRAAAEAAWQALAAEWSLPLHVFRLAGIYGPGRSPLEKVRIGTARRIVKPGQVFSRIHVDDLARVLEASIARPRPGIYNVCDDEPAPPEDVLAHAARLLGQPPPPEMPFDEAEMSPMARSFYADSKRVSNRRMREVLGVEPLYPSYREGLAAILSAEAADPEPRVPATDA